MYVCTSIINATLVRLRVPLSHERSAALPLQTRPSHSHQRHLVLIKTIWIHNTQWLYASRYKTYLVQKKAIVFSLSFLNHDWSIFPKVRSPFSTFLYVPQASTVLYIYTLRFLRCASMVTSSFSIDTQFLMASTVKRIATRCDPLCTYFEGWYCSHKNTLTMKNLTSFAFLAFVACTSAFHTVSPSQTRFETAAKSKLFVTAMADWGCAPRQWSSPKKVAKLRFGLSDTSHLKTIGLELWLFCLFFLILNAHYLLTTFSCIFFSVTQSGLRAGRYDRGTMEKDERTGKGRKFQ